MNFECLNKQI